ncbi:MAG TPA: MFS transporter [Kineosporiaceae bacterium]
MVNRSASGKRAAADGIVAAAGDSVSFSPRRWLLLACYVLLVVASQLVWWSFAPVTIQVGRALGVSTGAVGDLAGINPLLYVVIALPAGRWADRRFTATMTAGAALVAGGALLRCAGSTSFSVILAGQVLNAFGQPLVLNAPSKLAVRYFPAAERTVAISAATAAQFAGILVASTTGAALFDAGGLRGLLLVHALLAVAAAVLLVVVVSVTPRLPDSSVQDLSLRWLRGDRVTWRLAGLLFIGVGAFNALVTWLDPILHGFGHDQDSGPLITLMTASGVAGCAVLPPLAARRDRRRALLVTATALTVVVFVATALEHDLVFIATALALLGFVLLAGLPVALEWSELHVGPGRAGTAAGFLMCAGNLGGAVLVLGLQFLTDRPQLALLVLAAATVPGMLLATGLPAAAAVGPATEAPAATLVEPPHEASRRWSADESLPEPDR